MFVSYLLLVRLAKRTPFIAGPCRAIPKPLLPAHPTRLPTAPWALEDCRGSTQMRCEWTGWGHFLRPLGRALRLHSDASAFLGFRSELQIPPRWQRARGCLLIPATSCKAQPRFRVRSGIAPVSILGPNVTTVCHTGGRASAHPYPRVCVPALTCVRVRLPSVRVSNEGMGEGDNKSHEVPISLLGIYTYRKAT